MDIEEDEADSLEKEESSASDSVMELKKTLMMMWCMPIWNTSLDYLKIW